MLVIPSADRSSSLARMTSPSAAKAEGDAWPRVANAHDTIAKPCADMSRARPCSCISLAKAWKYPWKRRRGAPAAGIPAAPVGVGTSPVITKSAPVPPKTDAARSASLTEFALNPATIAKAQARLASPCGARRCTRASASSAMASMAVGWSSPAVAKAQARLASSCSFISGSRDTAASPMAANSSGAA
eukprot:scaffold33995_cov90-Isochrysis_galbana.AAC.1